MPTVLDGKNVTFYDTLTSTFLVSSSQLLSVWPLCSLIPHFAVKRESAGAHLGCCHGPAWLSDDSHLLGTSRGKQTPTGVTCPHVKLTTPRQHPDLQQQGLLPSVKMQYSPFPRGTRQRAGIPFLSILAQSSLPTYTHDVFFLMRTYFNKFTSITFSGSYMF